MYWDRCDLLIGLPCLKVTGVDRDEDRLTRGFDITRIAKTLGVSRATVYRCTEKAIA